MQRPLAPRSVPDSRSWTSSSASVRRGCCAPGQRWSSCCPAAATRSACSTSPSAWRARRPSSRCTSTTACATAAGADEAFCRELCVRLGVTLDVEPAQRPSDAGNLQAWARDVRLGAGTRLALARGARLATGHTATDQAETILYRLAASPGRRALLGMAEHDGLLMRPLLRATRLETAEHCRARGLAWREDASNGDPALRSQPRARRPRAGPARAAPLGRAQRRAHGRAAARRGGRARRGRRDRARRA